MTTLLEGARQLVTRGTDIGVRIGGLETAVEAGRGRLDDALLDDVGTVADRAAGRLKLSASHTVVAIAGATGSGKSSTFNALTGLELSSTGVRRPTTSWATACVWGSEGAEELLEWLGIPPRHQTMRESMLDSQRDDALFDGVVLMDLPDHDSTEVAHHLEVDRLIELADLFVWVLDPQKYADAAIHDRYLAPLRTHAGVMVVVLNHIDTVPEDRRQSMIDDVRRLLDNDGLQEVPVYAISARHDLGVEQLRGEIAHRVTEKKLTRSRIESDLRAAAVRLDEASGPGKTRDLPGQRVADLDSALAEAAGVPVLVAGVERTTAARIGRAVAWPPMAWLGGIGADPSKGLELDLGDATGFLTGRDARTRPAAPTVQRARVDAEVRSLADDVTRGLGRPWAEAVQSVSVARVDQLEEQLQRATAEADLGSSSLPGWASSVRIVQWLLLLAFVGGVVWTVVLAAGGSLGDAPAVAGAPLPIVLLVAGLVLGLVLWLVCRGAVAGAAHARAEAARTRLGEAVHRVADELVVAPVGTELEAHVRMKKGVAAARR